MICSFPSLLLALLPLANAIPHPVEEARAMITARAILGQDPIPIEKRGLASILGTKASSYINSIESEVETWFVGLPTGTAVLSSLGIDDGDLAAEPTQVLNIP